MSERLTEILFLVPVAHYLSEQVWVCQIFNCLISDLDHLLQREFNFLAQCFVLIYKDGVGLELNPASLDHLWGVHGAN